uniref:Uncharacterized protein n=1 Tax=Oryza glaberrima TaxID=4538 RepID=I1PR09_ORYGL
LGVSAAENLGNPQRPCRSRAAMRDGERAEVGAAGVKRKEASASSDSEPAGKKAKKKILPKWRANAIPCEGGEVLRRKKEAVAASMLWRTPDVPGASDVWDSIEVPAEMLELWLERQKAKAEAAAAKKKRKVFKCRVPNSLVEVMITQPYKCVDHNRSQEELAELAVPHRQIYILRKFIDEKKMNYEQTLIDQYATQGYAEDEEEVTDDDDDEDPATLT